MPGVHLWVDKAAEGILWVASNRDLSAPDGSPSQNVARVLVHVDVLQIKKLFCAPWSHVVSSPSKVNCDRLLASSLKRLKEAVAVISHRSHGY